MCSIQYVYIVCYVRNRTQDFSSATIKIENLLAESVVVVPPPAAGTLTLLLLFILWCFTEQFVEGSDLE